MRDAITLQQIDETILLMKNLLWSDPNFSNQIIPQANEKNKKLNKDAKIMEIIFDNLFSIRPWNKSSLYPELLFANVVLLFLYILFLYIKSKQESNFKFIFKSKSFIRKHSFYRLGK